MITSLSLSLLFLDETSFIHLFLHFFLYIFFLVTSRPESYFFLRRFLSSISLLLLLSFFFLFCFSTKRYSLALSSACRNVLRLQITRLFSTCTFLGMSSRTFTFSVRTFQTTREPTYFLVSPTFDSPTILHAKINKAIVRLPPFN